MRHPFPNLIHLHQFIAIAEQGSISDAARTLNVSQPAMSKGIRKLEETVGTQLFGRVANGVALTPAGELFLKHARSIALEYDHALQSIRNVINDQDSTINIIAGPIWSMIVIPTILGRFHRLFPRIRLNVKSIDTKDFVRDLQLGKAEIYAGVLPESEAEKDLKTKRVAQSDLVVLASKKHPLAKRAKVNAKELANYPFVLFSPSAKIFGSLAAYLRRNDASLPKVVLETNSLQSCIEVVLRENFLLFETAMIYRSGMGAGVVPLNMGEELHPFDIGLTHRSGLERISHYGRLLDIMSEAMLDFANPGSNLPDIQDQAPLHSSSCTKHP